MKVEELIEKLKELPPDKEVSILVDDDTYMEKITTVEIDELGIICIN